MGQKAVQVQQSSAGKKQRRPIRQGYSGEKNGDGENGKCEHAERADSSRMREVPGQKEQVAAGSQVK
jgi:hypothetical protein